MKNIFTTNKKMIQYAASAAAFLAFNEVAANIIYTDVDPDIVLSGNDTYTIDLNGDGNDDIGFNLYTYAFSYYSLPITLNIALASAIGTGNKVVGSLVTLTSFSGATYTTVQFTPLNSNIEIGPSANFYSGSPLIAANGSVFGFPYPSGTFGNWTGLDDKFLGVQMSDGTDNYYGWIRLSVSDAAPQVIIKDYAFKDNTLSIFTGQQVGISQSVIPDFANIYSNNQIIYIDISAQSISADFRLTDISGKIIMHQKLNTGINTVQCNNLTEGNYLANVTEGEQTIAKKLFIGK